MCSWIVDICMWLHATSFACLVMYRYNEWGWARYINLGVVLIFQYQLPITNSIDRSIDPPIMMDGSWLYDWVDLTHSYTPYLILINQIWWLGTSYSNILFCLLLVVNCQLSSIDRSIDHWFISLSPQSNSFQHSLFMAKDKYSLYVL